MKENLDVLAKRFRWMAEVRRKSSVEAGTKGDKVNAIAFSNSANAYDRCADEVERVADGETPPPPDTPWD